MEFPALLGDGVVSEFHAIILLTFALALAFLPGVIV